VVWLDNVERVEVSAEPVDRAACYRLEVNPTGEPLPLTLDAGYTTAAGESLAEGATVTLEPFSSILLFRPTQ
jgi:hypothetical protein